MHEVVFEAGWKVPRPHCCWELDPLVATKFPGVEALQVVCPVRGW